MFAATDYASVIDLISNSNKKNSNTKLLHLYGHWLRRFSNAHTHTQFQVAGTRVTT